MAIAVIPRHNLGLRGLHRLGLGDTRSIAAGTQLLAPITSGSAPTPLQGGGFTNTTPSPTVVNPPINQVPAPTTTVATSVPMSTLTGGSGPGVQIVNTVGGPTIADANGNTIYSQAEVAANPSLLTQVTASSGCPSGSVPTWTMGGSVCQYPGASATCEDPTGVCGSFLLPGQTLSQADQGWVMQSDGSWVWNGPGNPTTPSPGAINELTSTAVPNFANGVVTTNPTTPALTSNTTQNNPQPPANIGLQSSIIQNQIASVGGGTTSNTSQCPVITTQCPVGQQLSVDSNGCPIAPCVNIPGYQAASDVAMPFVDYSTTPIPYAGGSAGTQTEPSGPTTTTTTASCTGGFMDLFNSACSDSISAWISGLSDTEILLGVGGLAVIGFMMMDSGSGGRHR